MDEITGRLVPAGMPRSAFAALIAAQIVGIAWLTILPFLVGAMMVRFDLSPAGAGLMISTQLVGATLASFTLSRIINKIPARKVALGALALAALGNLITAIAADVEVLAVSRLIAGLGEGSLLACCAAAAALTGRAERMFAFYSIGVGASAVLALVVSPTLIARYGLAGGYGYLVAGDLVAAFFVAYGFSRKLHAPVHAEGRPVGAPGRVKIVALCAAFLFSISNAGVQTFLERIGVEGLGLSIQTLGKAMAIGASAAIFSPMLIIYLTNRVGRIPPIVVSGVLMSVCMLILALTSVAETYLIAAALIMPLGVFMQPYVVGVVAALDPSGKLSAGLPALSSIGFAIGPTLAGSAALVWGLNSVGIFSAVAVTLCVLFLLGPAYAADQGRYRPVSKS